MMLSTQKYPRLRDFLDLLEELAPSSLAEDWDNPGLQVGRRSLRVKKVLVALDPGLAAVREASRRGAQVLLTHHPLLFRPAFRIDQETPVGSVISEALRKDLSIVCLHTNLDVVQEGISDMLAEIFHLQDISVLKPGEREPNSGGVGRIGYLKQPLALRAMIKRVKSVLHTRDVRVVGDDHALVRCVAVVGGSGGSMVSAAFERGADLLITGDVGHHAALEARAVGLSVIDGGHFHTEKMVLPVFGERLLEAIKRRGWDVQVEVFGSEADPMRYK